MASPIPRTSLFTFTVPVHAANGFTVDGKLSEWTSLHQLPELSMDGGKPFAHVYAAWSAAGMWFALDVPRKSAPRVLPKRLAEGDSLELYVDTRDIRSAHRAGRYCHKFVLAPVGGVGRARSALFEHQDIQRALMNPPQVTSDQVEVASVVRDDGYAIELFVPAAALNGYDVDVTRRLGLAYVLRDTERYPQVWPHAADLPVWNDTSLWATIDLVD